ncbi:46 kDa FK506-binding nuclear protein [Holothuria leucospilota]|uniref:46 kDa FK506-binding nuclear protein n=1 Tax=Holothuria leucospilota TaxID=206669 RepID=A0A9Q1H3F5_HOLLE|nr:46 kDa FK506-binding nuclear protein [Holothuria leucospilota]
MDRMIWGITLEPNQLFTTVVQEEIHISMATMDMRKDGANVNPDCYSHVVVKTDNYEYLLCTLGHGMLIQQMLDLNLMPTETVTFTIEGTNSVYLTGYTLNTKKIQETESHRERELETVEVEEYVVGEVDDEDMDQTSPQKSRGVKRPRDSERMDGVPPLDASTARVVSPPPVVVPMAKQGAQKQPSVQMQGNLSIPSTSHQPAGPAPITSTHSNGSYGQNEATPKQDTSEKGAERFVVLPESGLLSLLPNIGATQQLLQVVQEHHKKNIGQLAAAIEQSPHPKRMKTFSMREALCQTAAGRDMLHSLDVEKVLSHAGRRKLVRMAVTAMVELYGDRPTNDQKDFCARTIVEEFPFLKESGGSGHAAWFSRARDRRGATGYLEERLKNYRKRQRARSGKPSVPQIPVDSTFDVTVESIIMLPDPDLPDEEAEEMKDWMKANCNPASQVEEYLKKTAIHRQHMVQDTPGIEPSVIIREYPRLLENPEVILQDFQLLYPQFANNLFNHWSAALADRCIKQCDVESPTWRRKFLINSVDALTEDIKWNLSFQLLPMLLPASAFRESGKTVMPNNEEYERAFIDVRPVGTDLPQYLQEIKESGKQSLQPFILLIGERINPSQQYVIVENHAIEQSSLAQSVDLCFKLFFVLNMEYPLVCIHIWEFLHVAVYKIPLGPKIWKTSSNVRYLKSVLNL